MNCDINICEYKKEYLSEVQNIFNLFAEESFAVYTEEKLSTQQIETMLQQAKIILVLKKENSIIGFGYISAYKTFKNFNRTGVVTYFILPEFTGKGLGKKLFNELIQKGKKLGITNYLAHISSKNTQSLEFHKRLNFIEVGRFKEVAVKFNELIDVVWMQKIINE